MTRTARLLAACVAALPVLAIGAQPLDEFRGLADNRLAVRSSFGVRSARPLSDRQIQVEIGMSVTRIAENPAAWRIISYDDPNYAYPKFVKPVNATTKREVESEGVAGAPFQKYEKTIVTLELPQPMKPSVRYYVMGQGVGGEMVTAANTAADFVFGAEQSAPKSSPELAQAVLDLRQVEPVGPGLIRLEFGPNFSPEAGAKAENYTVSAGGAPIKIANLGRRSMLDTYLPVGWPFAAIPMHSVYLQLERPLRNGEALDVQVNSSVTGAANRASLRFGDKTTLTQSIKVNQVGYLSDSPVKVAYLGRWMGSFPELKQAAAATGGNMDASQDFWAQLDQKQPAGDANQSTPAGSPALTFAQEPEFQVCSEQDGSVVFTGHAKLVHRSGEMNEGHHKIDHSGENVYLLDFTQLRTPGRYFISVPQVGRSYTFDIGNDVYKKAFDVQSYGVFAQRCGMELAPPFSEWRRVACHDDGLVVTSQVHGEQHSIRDLSKKVVYRSVAAEQDPAFEQLSRDPALVAHYPLNGDLKAAKGPELAFDGRPTFTADRKVLPGQNQVFGPTSAVESAGLRAPVSLPNTADGVTLTTWFKKDENNDFHGTLLGFGGGEWNKPRMMLTAGWGVLSFSVGITGENKQHKRINDSTWHHVALVLSPETQQPRIATLYVDGQSVDSAKASGEVEGDFVIAAMKGSQSAGIFMDDVRVYSRALQDTELAALSKPRPAEVPERIMATGGHHDAGDYNPRSHLDVAQTLMEAYEIAPRKFFDGQLNIPERGNGVPDVLDEAFWALRLWIDLQAADGGVHNGTESAGDPNFIHTVELDPTGDYAYAKDSAGSYNFAGAMAQASRLWRANGKQKEADDFLERARRAYNWANANAPKMENARQYAFQYLGPKAYASAQLLKTTSEDRFNKDFLDVCVWSRKPDAETEEYQVYDQSLAALAYATCDQKLVDPKIQEAVRKAIIRRADWFIANAQTMAYGFIRHPHAPINWGTGAYENYLPAVIWAWHLTGDEKYRYWMVRTCDNTLGANPMGISWIVGLGTRTVRAPLHNSRYSHIGEVHPGAQVEGPVQSGEGYRVGEVAYPPTKDDFAVMYTYVDAHFAISMNELVVPAQAKAMAAFGLLLPDRQ